MKIDICLISFLFLSSFISPEVSAPDFAGIDDDVEIIWKKTVNNTWYSNYTSAGGKYNHNIEDYFQSQIGIRFISTQLSGEANTIAHPLETDKDYNVGICKITFDYYYGYIENVSDTTWEFDDRGELEYFIFNDEETEDEYLALKIWHSFFYYPLISSTNINFPSVASSLQTYLLNNTYQPNISTAIVNNYNQLGKVGMNTTVTYQNMNGTLKFNICWDDQGILNHLDYTYNSTKMVSINQVYFNDFERDPPIDNDDDNLDNNQWEELKEFFYLIGGIAVATLLLYISLQIIKKKSD